MHANVFTRTGKRYLTRREAQRLIDDYGDYKAVQNGPLEIVED